jgi:Zn-dependent protease
VCPRCHTLVRAEELTRISAEAKALEAQRAWMRAREQWLIALPMMPPEAKQSEWIRAHVLELESRANTAPEQEPAWARKLGPAAPIALLLMKGKALLGLLKFNFLFSLIAFVGVYWGLYGAMFGVGFAALILIHEMGHFVEVKRRGLPADLPVFLPGFGAYVRWTNLGVSLQGRAAISLAGPFAGWIAAVACVIAWKMTGAPIWAALAHTSAWLNVLNLIPVWALDGGHAMQAMDKFERLVIVTVSVALWVTLHESLFALVAGGAVYRLFTKDIPQDAGRRTMVYFALLLLVFGAVMWAVPDVRVK